MSQDPSEDRLKAAVKRALWRAEPIRAVDLDRVDVEVRDGIVVLRGVVASDAHRFMAGQLARSISGVKDVANELTSDEDLERRAAIALATDEAARRYRVVVNVVGGVAGLYGAVPDEGAVAAVTAVVGAVPGMRGVRSKLAIVPPGTPVVLAWQHSTVMDDE